MEFFRDVIRIYTERSGWFLELTGAHIALALTAIVLAGVLGLLLGIWISECPRAAGPVLTVANILYTIPSISLLGMLIPVMGIGNPTAAGALVIGLTACAGSKDNGPVKIATKPMTEQYILGEMLRILIEEKAGYEVELTKGIGGGTSNIQPAMEKGEFDLYPEYTSSGWILVLGHEAGDVTDDEMFTELQKEYEEKYDMTWVGLYGQNNTYALVVRADTAEDYGLETCSDLAEVSDQLVFGGNPDYIERADGLPGVSAAYGLEFKDIMDIDIGLKYEALRNGDIDVTNGYTTDAQISQPDVKVLEDDLGYQVNYFCSTVVREDALEKYPKLEETLELMDGILTDQKMAELNYQVEEEGKDEADVARDYLVSAGILEEQ